MRLFSVSVINVRVFVLHEKLMVVVVVVFKILDFGFFGSGFKKTFHFFLLVWFGGGVNVRRTARRSQRNCNL